MPVELMEEEGGKVLAVTLSGKLTKEDYERLTPAVEKLVQAQKKIRVLCTMRDFHGWTLGALWEDMKFDMKHFGDIERLALVGDSKWEAGMSMFCKPFTKANIRYFDLKDATAAADWVKEA